MENIYGEYFESEKKILKQIVKDQKKQNKDFQEAATEYYRNEFKIVAPPIGLPLGLDNVNTTDDLM